MCVSTVLWIGQSKKEIDGQHLIIYGAKLYTCTQAIGGLPCGPLRDIGEAFQDEQAVHRQMVEKVQHPTVGEIPLAGKIGVGPSLHGQLRGGPDVCFPCLAPLLRTGIPVKYSKTRPSIRLPPPCLGQHTDEVLGKMFAKSELDQLKKKGVIA